MYNITRLVALPLLTAGILGGTLGLAGTAAAATTAPKHDGHVATTPRDARSHMPTQPRVFSPTVATSPRTHVHTPDAVTYRHRHHRHFHRVW
ncbi:MAG: hypothetical protein AB1925_22585 [Actinomycetota bacterium]